MSTTYERETKEFQAVTVTVEGAAVTTNVELALVPAGARPIESSWKAPDTLGGRIGVMLTGLTRGRYRIWYRVTDNPEIPVGICEGFVTIN